MELATYALTPEKSRGRLYADFTNVIRSPFQRDRDRLIHSSAFRRLDGKTQVFAYHEGKNYRTRLTHSIEVAQITRTICKCLGLNEELGEAIALAHDLGHSPFGHAGERGLQNAMKKFGGFDHNIQSLKIMTKLEIHYPEFEGLNLTWETLEGTVKHNGPIKRITNRYLKEYNKNLTLTSGIILHWKDRSAQLPTTSPITTMTSTTVSEPVFSALKSCASCLLSTTFLKNSKNSIPVQTTILKSTPLPAT